jgi:hypothetical protein
MTSIYWYTGISIGLTPDGRYGSFRAVTIISVISWPVTVTRLIAESPPTFTVWQPSGPAPGGSGVDDGAGGGSSALPESSVGASVLIGVVRVGVGEEVRVGVGKDVRVGVGEDVRAGVGEVVKVGVCEEVRVGVGKDVRVGVGEVVKVGVGEEVRVGVGKDVRVGVGEVVKVGVGEEVTAGVGVAVGVGAGVGEVVGSVVSGGATTVTYPGRLRALVTVRFRTVRFTVYIPGVPYT